MIANRDRKGRTATGKHTYRPLVQLQPDDFPPNSNYWQGRALASFGSLTEKMGEAATDEWFDAAVTDEDTWRVIDEKCNAKITELAEATFDRIDRSEQARPWATQ